MKNKIVSGFIVSTFVTLYLMVSLISTIHVIEFFRLSNPEWLAISLAIAFEVGAAASLASIIALKKMNQGLVWMLFIVLTLMQAMGNTYYAFTNLENFSGWVELFDLVDEEVIYQKRVLSIISGAILPLVALGFIKSLVDYIKPEGHDIDEEDEKILEIKENENIVSEIEEDEDKYEDLIESEDEKEFDLEETIGVKKEQETPILEVDGGNSSTQESIETKGRMLSSEHYSGIPNVNSNKIEEKKDIIKRYPENLE